jgi:hypothetical protein
MIRLRAKSLEAFTEHEEYFSRPIFTIVDIESTTDQLVEATKSVIGDLTQPEILDVK